MRKAFSLIELLVVIAIIAVLLSVLLPSFTYIREYRNELNCITNLRSMGQGLQMYLDNYGGNYFPYPDPPTSQYIDMYEHLSFVMDAPELKPGVRSTPWTCPSDQYDFWKWYGSSYQYYPGQQINIFKTWHPSTPPYNVTQVYEMNPHFPWFSDISYWHRGPKMLAVLQDNSSYKFGN